MQRKRFSDPFWCQCYTAALTGLTMAGALQIGGTSHAAGHAMTPAPGDSGSDDNAPQGALVKLPEAGLAAAEPDSDDDELVPAGIDPYRAALVREAMAIADASLDIIKGPLEAREARLPREVHRPPATEIGRVPVHNTR